MLVEYTRVVAECDGCGHAHGSDEDRVSWFDTFDQAREELSGAGWSGLDPEERRVLCARCTCEQHGHRPGEVVASVTWPGRGFLDCQRCDHIEIVIVEPGSESAAGPDDVEGAERAGERVRGDRARGAAGSGVAS